RREVRRDVHQPVDARRRADRGAGAQAAGRAGRADHGPAGRGLGAAEPERLLGHRRGHPARATRGQRQGGRREARRRPSESDRRGSWPDRAKRPGPDAEPGRAPVAKKAGVVDATPARLGPEAEQVEAWSARKDGRPKKSPTVSTRSKNTALIRG